MGAPPAVGQQMDRGRLAELRRRARKHRRAEPQHLIGGTDLWVSAVPDAGVETVEEGPPACADGAAGPARVRGEEVVARGVRTWARRTAASADSSSTAVASGWSGGPGRPAGTRSGRPAGRPRAGYSSSGWRRNASAARPSRGTRRAWRKHAPPTRPAQSRRTSPGRSRKRSSDGTGRRSGRHSPRSGSPRRPGSRRRHRHRRSSRPGPPRQPRRTCSHSLSASAAAAVAAAAWHVRSAGSRSLLAEKQRAPTASPRPSGRAVGT